MTETFTQVDYPFMPEAGQKYQHYKGGIYTILVAIALYADTQEPFVVYQSVNDNRVWIRSLADFTAILGDKKEGTYYYRFNLIP